MTDAEKSCLRAKGLTQQLLTFAKGGAPVVETASVEKIVRESAVFALRGSNVDCEFRFAKDLCSVQVDQGQISQVINNLTINADQAMPNGGSITITAINERASSAPEVQSQTNQLVRIIVQDTGVGIPGEYLEKIFDPYFTTKQRGSGLGLATSYSIIKNVHRQNKPVFLKRGDVSKRLGSEVKAHGVGFHRFFL